jgi:hypothetical protein
MSGYGEHRLLIGIKFTSTYLINTFNFDFELNSDNVFPNEY